ncbi:hypothetical protein FPOA_06353 [Fusarium poae]|uniref:Uncharacterized protein n=1 Tax=Fusarium poae TaxID=36050 RepID=A0A1B8AZ99_FUSPO|nr:hypothetical protein FPOA_06353 [Fusarium poae]
MLNHMSSVYIRPHAYFRAATDHVLPHHVPADTSKENTKGNYYSARRAAASWVWGNTLKIFSETSYRSLTRSGTSSGLA